MVPIFSKKVNVLITTSRSNCLNFFRESEQKLNEMVSRDFALPSAAHEVGQVFIKNEPHFHFLEEPKMLESLVYFIFFSEKLRLKVGVILENVGIFKGKLDMSYLKKLVITKYTKIINFVHFL